MLKKMRKKDQLSRNSGIECLRIVFMVLILFAHSNYWLSEQTGHSLGIKWDNLLTLGADVAVAGFFIITGYFLDEYRFYRIKLINLCGGYLFYTVLGIIFRVILDKNVRFDDIQKSLFPVTSSTNWFMATYTLIYCFLPWIQLSIQWLNNNRDSYKKLMILWLVLFSVNGSLIIWNQNNSNILGGLMCIYLGAYIRKLYMQYNFFLMSIGVVICCAMIYGLSGRSIYLDNLVLSHLIVKWGVVSIGIATVMVLIFAHVKKQSVIVNGVAHSMFGIYLFHDNYIIAPKLFGGIIHFLKIHKYSITNQLKIVIIVFALSMLVEWCRLALLNFIWWVRSRGQVAYEQ